MTALVSVRRRWTAGALAGGFAALAVLGALVWVGADTLRNSKEGRPANTLPDARELPPTPAALLAVRDDDGALTALSVLALAPPDSAGVPRGGTVIPVPVGAAVPTGDGVTLARLADVYADGGLSGLTEAAGALLSLNFAVAAEVDQERLQQLLSPLGELEVDMPGDVIDTSSSEEAAPDSDDAGAEVVVPAGKSDVSAAQAAALLAAWDDDAIESLKLEQSIAFWIGAQGRIGDGLALGAERSAPTESVTNFFRLLVSGPIRVYGLRGWPISTGAENPDGGDMYRLVPAEVTRVMATVLPDSVSPIDVSFTVQIIDPFGDPAITEAAISRLGFPGVGIVLVRELSGIEVPAVTQISLGGRVDIGEVQPYADGLGQTEVVALDAPGTPHGRVQGVDATFVLGQSFVDLLQRQSTTTVVPSTTGAATVTGANETTDTTTGTETSGTGTSGTGTEASG